MENTIVGDVMRIFQEIDRNVSEFQTQTSLMCPPGCGKCCKSDKVEATITELLPMVAELFRRGEAPLWHEKILNTGGKGPCVFYMPAQSDLINGRCTMYEWRPSICRLFGFSSNKNKNGKNEFASCEHLKKIYPEIFQAASQSVSNGLRIPGLSEFHLRIAGLSSDNHLLPINGAIRFAIEKYGLWIQMVQAQQVGEAIQAGVVYSAAAVSINLILKRQNAADPE